MAISTINSRTNTTNRLAQTPNYYILSQHVSLCTHHLQLDKPQFLPWSLHKAIFALGMLTCNLSLWFHPHWSVNKLRAGKLFYHFSQFSCSVVSDTLQPHGLQHARLPCPSPTPRVCSNSCPSSQGYHPTISSSVAPSSPALNLSQHQGLF